MDESPQNTRLYPLQHYQYRKPGYMNTDQELQNAHEARSWKRQNVFFIKSLSTEFLELNDKAVWLFLLLLETIQSFFIFKNFHSNTDTKQIYG